MPDYREELIDIYKDLRPLGLNNRSLQSIEDVTNPCLNSINEKCARIRIEKCVMYQVPDITLNKNNPAIVLS